MQGGGGRVTHTKLIPSLSHLSMVKSMTTLQAPSDNGGQTGREASVWLCECVRGECEISKQQYSLELITLKVMKLPGDTVSLQG